MEKIKQFVQTKKGKDILTILVVILVGISSFGLGRLSVVSKSSELKILQASLVEGNLELKEETPATLSAKSASSNQNSDKKYFASVKGSKYYPVGCSAGKSIKIENRKYFATKEAAEKSGYQLSNSCK